MSRISARELSGLGVDGSQPSTPTQGQSEGNRRSSRRASISAPPPLAPIQEEAGNHGGSAPGVASERNYGGPSRRPSTGSEPPRTPRNNRTREGRSRRASRGSELPSSPRDNRPRDGPSGTISPPRTPGETNGGAPQENPDNERREEGSATRISPPPTPHSNNNRRQPSRNPSHELESRSIERREEGPSNRGSEQSRPPPAPRVDNDRGGPSGRGSEQSRPPPAADNDRGGPSRRGSEQSRPPPAADNDRGGPSRRGSEQSRPPPAPQADNDRGGPSRRGSEQSRPPPSTRGNNDRGGPSRGSGQLRPPPDSDSRSNDRSASPREGLNRDYRQRDYAPRHQNDRNPSQFARINRQNSRPRSEQTPEEAAITDLQRLREALWTIEPQQRITPHHLSVINRLRDMKLYEPVSRERCIQREVPGCYVCYECFGEPSPEGHIEFPVETTQCRHIFGRECLELFIEENLNPDGLIEAGGVLQGVQCPMCRTPFKDMEDVLFDELGDSEQEIRMTRVQEKTNLRDRLRLPTPLDQIGAMSQSSGHGNGSDILMQDISQDQSRDRSGRARSEELLRQYERVDAIDIGRPVVLEGFVVSQQRQESGPARYILKEVVGVFAVGKGFQLLLRYPSADQDLYCYDLEAASLHPGKKEEYCELYNVGNLDPPKLSSLGNLEYGQLELGGVASVKQNLRRTHNISTGQDAISIPKRTPITRLGYFLPGKNYMLWFFRSDISEYFKNLATVDADILDYRRKTGQYEQVRPIKAFAFRGVTFLRNLPPRSLHPPLSPRSPRDRRGDNNAGAGREDWEGIVHEPSRMQAFERGRERERELNRQRELDQQNAAERARAEAQRLDEQRDRQGRNDRRQPRAHVNQQDRGGHQNNGRQNNDRRDERQNNRRDEQQNDNRQNGRRDEVPRGRQLSVADLEQQMADIEANLRLARVRERRVSRGTLD